MDVEIGLTFARRDSRRQRSRVVRKRDGRKTKGARTNNSGCDERASREFLSVVCLIAESVRPVQPKSVFRIGGARTEKTEPETDSPEPARPTRSQENARFSYRRVHRQPPRPY